QRARNADGVQQSRDFIDELARQGIVGVSASADLEHARDVRKRSGAERTIELHYVRQQSRDTGTVRRVRQIPHGVLQSMRRSGTRNPKGAAGGESSEHEVLARF